MNTKKWIYFFSGISFGVGLGFLLGVLEAPDSGERTRMRFAKKAGRFKHSVAGQFSKN